MEKDTGTVPSHLIDWQGNDWTPEIAKQTGAKAAHPNSRFTVAATNNPALDPQWDDANGVAIDAFIFGGRRSNTVPLATEARTWIEGVYMAATMGSETTAAAFGAQGVVRRDPFAMLPFCGYNMSDYFQHWLDMEKSSRKPATPAQDLLRQLVPQGRRRQVRLAGLRRQHARHEVDARPHRGQAEGEDHAFGISPKYDEINWEGLDFSREQFESVTDMNPEHWKAELALHDEHFEKLAYHLPSALVETKARMEARILGQ